MTEIAWLNGEIIPAEQAAVPVFDLGVVAGASVTEMIRTFNHKPYRLSDHLDRLSQSLDMMGFETPFSRADLEAAVTQVIGENTSALEPANDIGVIVFVTAGLNPTYLGAAATNSVRFGHGTACVHTFQLPFNFWASKYTTGQRLATSSVAAISPQALNPQAKHRNRLHWYLADREVRSANAGTSVLMTNSSGHVTETSAGNFYLLRNKTIRTAPADLVLGGISQAALREIAGEFGYRWETALITLDDILASDEAWTTSTPYCLLPVTEFNNKPIGDGRPGLAFQELIAAWSNAVNLDIVAQATQAAGL
jgi:branched-chain amino acid aminotransferase